MDGKLPPWNIHGSHSNSVPYTSGECQEGCDLTGESMPSLSSCMSGAFKALLPDYHGTSSAMTTNSVKYPYSPDDDCPIKSSPGMSYIENTTARRMPLDEPSVTNLPPKCTQYMPQERDQEVYHGNSPNWTSVIKHALEMSNGMEMGQTISVDVCSPLVDLNNVYKQPQTEITGSKPNEKQEGREVKREQDSFVAMLSDSVFKQQNVQDMGINQKSNVFAEGSPLNREKLGMTDIRGHEPVSLPGFYRSHTPHSLDDYMKCDESSGIPLVKQPVEHTLLKTTQGPELSCKVGSPRKTLESCTNICFKDAKVNNETNSDNSTVCGLYHLDLQKGGLQAGVMDGKTSVNSQHHPPNPSDQEEMVNQNNLHVSDTTLTNYFVSKVENQVSTPASGGTLNTAVVECENSKLWIPREEGVESNLPVPKQIKSKGLNTKNTEPNLKLEAKFATEIITFSNETLSSGIEKVTDQPVLSIKMHTDDKFNDCQGESGKLNKLCSQENNSKNGTVTLTTNSVSVNDSTDVCEIHVQEKQCSANEGSVFISTGEKAQNSEKSHQTFLNNATKMNILEVPPHPISSSDCFTQPNLQNALQRHKKTRKRKKSELEELNGQILKTTKMGDCSLYGSEISDAVKSGTIMSEGEGFVTQSSSQLLGSHDEQLEVVADTAETSEKPGHMCSEASREKDTSNAGNIIQKEVGNNKDKPSYSVKKAVYRRKRKKISRLCLKGKISATLNNQCLSQTSVSSPEEDYTSHSQVTLVEAKAVSNEEQSSLVSQQTICNLKTSLTESNPEKDTQQSKKTKALKAIIEAESKGDSTQASNVCQTASHQGDVLSSVEVVQESYNMNRLQRPGRHATKTFGDKNYKPLDRESFLDSVSQTDSVSTSVIDPLNILSPQNNPRNPRQKKRADVSEAGETLKVCPAVFQQEEIPSPLSKFKENMESNKTTSPVKVKRPVKGAIRKNLNEDHEPALQDIQTSTSTLKQDSISTTGTEVKAPVVLRTRKTPVKKASLSTVSENYKTAHLNDLVSSASGKVVDSVSATENTKNISSRRKKIYNKSIEEQMSSIDQTCSQQEDVTTVPSKSVASGVVSSPEKTVKNKRYSINASRSKTNNNHLNGETSLLSIVTQENSISPQNSRKKAVTEIRDEAALKVSHTESQHEDLAVVPDAIIAAITAHKTFKRKRATKKARRQVKNHHLTALLDMQTSTATLKQADGVPTSFVLTTPKKSKTKKMYDIKCEEADIPAVDQISAQQEISTLLAESDDSIVPPNERRFRTPQTSGNNTNTASENFQPAQNEQLFSATGNPVGSVSISETDYSDVFSQQNTVKTKRPTKKVKRRKTQDIQTISNFEEQTSPATVQELNSVLMRNKSKNLMPEPNIKKDIVNETAEDHGETEIIVPPEDVASPQSSPKKAKKICLKKEKRNEQTLHHSTSETVNILKLAQEVGKMSDLPSVLEKSVSENFKTSEIDSCDQKWKASKKKSKKFKQNAKTHGLASVSLSQETLSSGESANILKTTEIKTEEDEADIMVTNADMQDFCTFSEGQAVKGLKCPEKDGSEVDVVIKQETTIKFLKVTKVSKTKKRKTAKKKRKLAGLLNKRVKEEEQRDISCDNNIASDIQSNHKTQISAAIPEEPMKSNVHISRKSTRIQKINSGPVFETSSTHVNSTVTLDITESSTRPEEILSSSMHTVDCKDLKTANGISMSTEKKTLRRGRPKKQKSSVAQDDNTAPIQISHLPSCQGSTEKSIEAAANQVKQIVVQPIKKRGRRKKLTVTKKLKTDPSEQSVSDQSNNTLSQSIPELGCKKQKNCKGQVRNLKLSLRVSSRTSELSPGNTDTSSFPQDSPKVFKKIGLKTSLPMQGAGGKQKLDEKTTVDEVMPADVKIEEINHGKHGRKRQTMKKSCFDLKTQPEELQRLKTEATNNNEKSPGEPAKSFTTMFSITDECSNSIVDQKNILMFSSEKSDNDNMRSTSVEISPAINAETCEITPKTEILCSSSTHLSSRSQSNFMEDIKKNKVKEASDKECFEVSLHSSIDNKGVCSEICGLLPSNVIKKEGEPILLDTKIKAYTELRCTQEASKELSVETSRRKGLDNTSEMAHKVKAFQLSAVQKVDDFTQYSKHHVAMPNKLTNTKKIGSKARGIGKKPLMCKFCGISFRHITAYVTHQRIHTGEKPYKCRSCGKTFAQLSKLKAHRNVHKQPDAFPCPCCSRKFLQREDLLCHFKVHLQESKVNTKLQKNVKNKRDTSSDVSSKSPNNYRGLICKFCKKCFVNPVKLRIHMHIHEEEKPLQCKDCGKKFWKSASLAVHERRHWPVKPYACSICGKGFYQLKALKKHSEDHTGETPFSCSHCGHAFSALSALRVHQASKTCIARRNDGDSCDIEGFIVSQGVDGQVNTPVFFRCQICKQLFKKWCQYTLHLQTHTSSSPYLCFSCGQCYEKDSEVNVHCKVCCQSSGEEKACGASVSEIMQGFNQTRPDYHCISKNTSDGLPQSLPSTEYLMNSQTLTSPDMEHLSLLPHSPEVESTQTRATDLSELPEVNANQSPSELPIAQSPARSEISCTSSNGSLECIEISPSLWKFQCSRCGQRFERYRMLQAHLQTHAPGFRYTCAHCGQFFERWNKLWLHQRHHRSKGRCYSCTQCNLQFRFFGSYKEHMLEHAEQRPYACPLCPKTFIQEESLHAHQYESHKLCKSLKCDVCSKTFSSLRNLIKHSLLHNGSTSHICLLCSLSFTNTRALQQHLKMHPSYHGLPLPDIPSKPLDFPHKCKRCKACFSTGDLLYAHQICHSRDAKTKVHPAVQSTSESSDTHNTDKQPVTPIAYTNRISNLKLDEIPNNKSLYRYSHPDRLYVPPNLFRARHQVIHLDSHEHEVVSGSQNTSSDISNTSPSASSKGSISALPIAVSQSDRTPLPQATSSQETTNLKPNDIIKDMANNNIQNKYKNSLKHQRRSTFVETSINMEVVHEESEESFECADCTEKLTSVLGLYEHYILHAMGDTYVQVH